MHLQKGQTNQRETLDCALPHGTLQFNSTHRRDQSEAVCVLELKETKIRSQAELFSLVCTPANVFQSSHTTFWFYCETLVWMNEQLCHGMYVRDRL